MKRYLGVPVTWISDRDEKELTRWKKVWRERAVWV